MIGRDASSRRTPNPRSATILRSDPLTPRSVKTRGISRQTQYASQTRVPEWRPPPPTAPWFVGKGWWSGWTQLFPGTYLLGTTVNLFFAQPIASITPLHAPSPSSSSKAFFTSLVKLAFHRKLFPTATSPDRRDWPSNTNQPDPQPQAHWPATLCCFTYYHPKETRSARSISRSLPALANNGVLVYRIGKCSSSSRVRPSLDTNVRSRTTIFPSRLNTKLSPDLDERHILPDPSSSASSFCDSSIKERQHQ